MSNIQSPANIPRPKKVAECSAYLDMHRENRTKRFPVEEKSAGIRRPRMRLRQRTANRRPYPTKISDIQRHLEKSI